MSLDAGRLRHRVTIEANLQAQDATTGALIDSWQAIATVWAEIAPLSVRDFVASAASNSEVNTRITIRYMAGITPDMRIMHGSKAYYISGLLPDPESGTEYISVACSTSFPER